MGSRFVRPETVTLTLANGDTLTVKKRLTSGEQRAGHARLYIAGVDGRMKINPLQTGIVLITTYLIDWKLSDDDVPICGLSVDDLASVIDNLDQESFTEIMEAIESHEQAMLAEREAAKKKTAGVSASDQTSPLPLDAAGVSSGSVN